MNDEPKPQLLKAAEVAALFRISRPTLSRRVADGSIPAIWIGNMLRFDRVTIEELIAKAAAPSS